MPKGTHAYLYYRLICRERTLLEISSKEQLQSVMLSSFSWMQIKAKLTVSGTLFKTKNINTTNVPVCQPFTQVLVFLTDCCCPQKPLRQRPPVGVPGGAPAPRETTSTEGDIEEEEEDVTEKAEGKDEIDESTVRQRKTGSGETEEET